MKHLPNILTLANLFFGCMAITFVLHARPFLAEINGSQYWISGTTQACFGSICILLAGLCDVLDGMTARWLGVSSSLGKDLDSLADVVSFGVAPGMIIYQMLWAAWMRYPDAIDVPVWVMMPAFLIPCFGALRLARFNNSPATTHYFTGVPIPAIGLVLASLPYINQYNPMGAGIWLQHLWVLYTLILLLCWLMISRLRMFTLKFSGFSLKRYSAQFIWLALSLCAVMIFKSLAVPISFLLYILLSLIFKPTDA